MWKASFLFILTVVSLPALAGENVKDEAFLNSQSVACLSEMGRMGHHAFSYSASLDAFMFGGVRDARPGYFYLPVAATRGTDIAPKMYFIDQENACPEEKWSRARGASFENCTVQAQAGIQPVEIFFQRKKGTVAAFATRPALLVGRQIKRSDRFEMIHIF
jgi:hypothetical protein